MCEFCNNVETGDDYLSLVEATIDFGVLDKQHVFAYLHSSPSKDPLLSIGFGIVGFNSVKVHYCPMCGQDLVKLK